MRDNPILPYSSLSDVIDKIKTPKTSNVCIFSWQIFQLFNVRVAILSLGVALNWKTV